MSPERPTSRNRTGNGYVVSLWAKYAQDPCLGVVMSERSSLRGTRLGAQSLESDEGVEPAPRQMAEYICPDGSTLVVPFSTEADVPVVWESNGVRALLKGAEEPDETPHKHQRTHWDMLLERRSIDELEELLAERLELLRSGQLHRRSA